MKLEPGTCLKCAELAIDNSLWREGLDWILSPEDGLCHWGREVSARTCGELHAIEYEVTCGRGFVRVEKVSA